MLKHKTERVKVGVRCRPPFEAEVYRDTANKPFKPVVTIFPGRSSDVRTVGDLPKVQLSVDRQGTRTRDFYYDYAFGPQASQDEVYDTVAGPIVEDVLRGFNGTVFAYGQTGTGKTYTMGILERVCSERAGIVPRSLAHIFGLAEMTAGQANGAPEEIRVTVSFLQIYRETIQDLLAPALANDPSHMWDENLAIREDPQRGFYVEGLHEYSVRSYEEAEALVNLGLENRAMAPTLMNTTSSRSHTVLTVRVEQHWAGEGEGGDRGDAATGAIGRTIRGKLMLVDLAGSERIRRTTSKGARLSEAKAINTSLSALGNVIAALADANVTHVPFRDSKLTRLLQDSLGGTANTAMIATVGPARRSQSETLSTLLFATRCMHVKSNPVVNEEINYEELCAKMQAQLAGLESEFLRRQALEQERYEDVIGRLSAELQSVRHNQDSHAPSPAGRGQGQGLPLGSPPPDSSAVLRRLSRPHTHGGVDWSPEAIMGILGDESASESGSAASETGNGFRGAAGGMEGGMVKQLVVLLSYCYEVLCNVADGSSASLEANKLREQGHRKQLGENLQRDTQHDLARQNETDRMAAEDPQGGDAHAGPHLAKLTRREARLRVDTRFHSNNSGWTGKGEEEAGPFAEVVGRQWDAASDPDVVPGPHPALQGFNDPAALVDYVNRLQECARRNEARSGRIFELKDAHYQHVKEELVSQIMERRQREEEVVNWSFVLKYLLSTNSKLRRQLHSEQALNAKILSEAASMPSFVGAPVGDASRSPSAARTQPQARATSSPSGRRANGSLRDEKARRTLPAPLSMPSSRLPGGGHAPAQSPLSPVDAIRFRFRQQTQLAAAAGRVGDNGSPLASRLAAGTRAAMAANAKTESAIVKDDAAARIQDGVREMLARLSSTETGMDAAAAAAAAAAPSPALVYRQQQQQQQQQQRVAADGGKEAVAEQKKAAAVAEQVRKMTWRQIQKLPPEHRAMVLRVRQELGITEGHPAGGGGGSSLSYNWTPASDSHNRGFGNRSGFSSPAASPVLSDDDSAFLSSDASGDDRQQHFQQPVYSQLDAMSPRNITRMGPP